MKLTRYKSLFEKTFNINQDVDYLYNQGFKNFINQFKKRKIDKNIISKILRGNDIIFFTIESKNLPSKICKLSSLINPVTIFCGIYLQGNFYDPLNKQIILSINFNALRFLIKNNFNIENSNLSSLEKKEIINEITDYRIKSSIGHELSHWLDDTNHNNHLNKIVNLAAEMNNKEIMFLNKKDVNMTYFEIDAQIQSIKQLKRKYKNTWNNLTINDIFLFNPSLMSIKKKLYKYYGKDILFIWMKNLLKRMARENLVGKNMRSF